jgi:RecB family exonuclease
VPFLVKWQGLILNGKIDLLLADPDGSFWIVDYKTSASHDPEYEDQLVTYALALSAFVSARFRLVLVYLRPDREPREREVEFGPDQARRMEEQAEEFAGFLREDSTCPPRHREGCRLLLQ